MFKTWHHVKLVRLSRKRTRDADNPLQLGDRFTVTGKQNGDVCNLLSHRDGNNYRLKSRYLEEVCYSPAGRLEPAGMLEPASIQALRAVLREEEPAALQAVNLDLERARMESERARIETHQGSSDIREECGQHRTASACG